VSVIDWSFKKTTGPSKDPEYVASFASTLDYLAGAHGFNIVFIPTVIDRNNPWDDVVKSKQIQSRMKHAGSSVIIDRILRPGQLAGVYARCQFAIVTRMHAAILCTGAGQKPVVAVNYLYKLREYMKNIEFENSSVDIDHVTPDNLRQMSDDMLAHYSQHHQQLTTRMNELKDRLNQDISSVKY
jgi:polysaccharide pyruvyl transferase WcaK-like protein